MANQSPDRREVLTLLGKVAALSQFPGFSRWVCAASPANKRAASYEPLFFSAAEYRTVNVIAEHIIPADESPGAQAAGVAEFIDFMVAHDVDLQYSFRTGLAWLDAFAVRNNGERFETLASHEQKLLLRRVAYRNEQSVSEPQGQEFFRLIRKYTVIGYYTSRIGLEELDYPGLRLYGSSPECPHKDDPEHRNLGAPTV